MSEAGKVTGPLNRTCLDNREEVANYVAIFPTSQIVGLLFS